VTGPLSLQLGRMAEEVGSTIDGGRSISVPRLYAALIRARDEAVLLEARAGERDAYVRRLLADIENQCVTLATADALARAHADKVRH